jgi:hypothetical protein
MLVGAYNHVSFARAGADWYVGLNGKIVGHAVATGIIGAGSAAVHIGRDPASSGPRYVNGRIAQFRWTLGKGRYTDDYEVPTEPFSLRGSRVAGTVKKGSPPAPCARKIILLRPLDQAVVGTGASDTGTGEYEIETDADVGEALIGISYTDYGDPWVASHVYALGDRTWVGEPAPLGHWYECEQAGTTGSTEPTWPTDGSTVTDGTVIWRDKGVMERPWAEGPYIAEAV